MKSLNRTKRAMANIWEINVNPVDGLSYLERLLELDLLHIEYISCTQQDVKQFVNKVSCLNQTTLNSSGRRRNAYGNIWDFEMYHQETISDWIISTTISTRNICLFIAHLWTKNIIYIYFLLYWLFRRLINRIYLIF